MNAGLHPQRVSERAVLPTLLALAALYVGVGSGTSPATAPDSGNVPTTRPSRANMEQISELVREELLRSTTPSAKEIISALKKGGYSLPEIANAAEQLRQVSGYLSLTQELLHQVGQLDPLFRPSTSEQCHVPGKIYIAPSKPMGGSTSFVDPLGGPTTLIVGWAASTTELKGSGVTGLEMRVKVEPIEPTKELWRVAGGGYFTGNGSVTLGLPEVNARTTVKVSLFLFPLGPQAAGTAPWRYQQVITIDPQAPAGENDTPFDLPHEVRLHDGTDVPDLVWGLDDALRQLSSRREKLAAIAEEQGISDPRPVAPLPQLPEKLTLQRVPLDHPSALPADTTELSTQTGKPQLLKIGASWCGPCHQTNQHFEELFDRLGEQASFTTLYLGGSPQDFAGADRHQKKFKVPFGVLSKESSTTLMSLQDGSVPLFIILGSDGSTLYLSNTPPQETLVKDLLKLK